MSRLLGVSTKPGNFNRPADRYAIEEFQCDAGLAIDGIPGDKTEVVPEIHDACAFDWCEEPPACELDTRPPARGAAD